MKSARKLLWLVVVVALAITTLPYFGILNGREFIGPFPQPLAVTLACNVVLTLCVFAIYWLYFKPFFAAIARKPIVEKK